MPTHGWRPSPRITSPDGHHPLERGAQPTRRLRGRPDHRLDRDAAAGESRRGSEPATRLGPRVAVVANDLLSDTRPRVQESDRNQPFLSDVHDRVSDIVTVVTPLAAGAGIVPLRGLSGRPPRGA